MKFVSWNVNGIRAALKKGFLDFVHQEKPDVLCLQEVRAEQEQVDIEIQGYDCYWYAAEKKGYSGTAIFTKPEVLKQSFGLKKKKHDHEGRVITLEYPDYFLLTVYTPNSKRGLARLDYRTKEWEPAFLSYLKKLEKTKPVIFCGDLNVAHNEIDLANPLSNQNNAGFTPQERACFTKIIKHGFIDTFRVFIQEGGHYTWWSNFANSRERNIGWRIDYFCVSQALASRLKKSYILPQVYGSDHCPIVMILA